MSVDAVSDCLTKPSGSSHKTCHGNSVTGTPEAFAQTVSPRTKSVCGVVQVAPSKVAMGGGVACGIGKNEENVDDHDARLIFVGATELSPLVLTDCPDGTFNLEELVRGELDLTE